MTTAPTAEQQAALADLHTSFGPSDRVDNWLHAREVKIPSCVRELLAEKDLAERLLQQTQQQEVALNLSYVLDAEPCSYSGRSVISSEVGACGSSACIGGHIALLKARSAIVSEGLSAWRLDSLPGVNWANATVRLHGLCWGAMVLAILVWRSTYPDADVTELYLGLTEPYFIHGRYSAPDEPVLMYKHLEAFLPSASGQEAAAYSGACG